MKLGLVASERPAWLQSEPFARPREPVTSHADSQQDPSPWEYLG